MKNQGKTLPPPVDPVMKAFEELSAKMDRFNETLGQVLTLLLEDRAERAQLRQRVEALESIPPPGRQPNGSGDA